MTRADARTTATSSVVLISVSALVALIGLLGLARPAFAAYPSASAGRIAFQAVQTENTDIFLMNADGANNEVRTLVRETGEVVGAFGRNGRNAGEFHWIHNLAVDSKGNIYTTEVDTGKRAQKVRYVGPPLK